MPTLLDSADREALLQRLRRLQPSSQPRWGTFTAPRMVCHLADALRVGLGDVSSKGVDTFLSRTLLKWLVVYSPAKPPPGQDPDGAGDAGDGTHDLDRRMSPRWSS